jgi:MinD superfamily P-loop ATPase
MDCQNEHYLLERKEQLHYVELHCSSCIACYVAHQHHALTLLNSRVLVC